jgi:hypothetical protein
MSLLFRGWSPAQEKANCEKLRQSSPVIYSRSLGEMLILPLIRRPAAISEYLRDPGEKWLLIESFFILKFVPLWE